MAKDINKSSGWVVQLCIVCERPVDPRLSEECDLAPGYCSEKCELEDKQGKSRISMEDVDRDLGPEDIDDRFDRQRDGFDERLGERQ